MPTTAWPLDGVRKNRIRRNLPELVELVDPRLEFVYDLYRADCINWQQRQDIEDTATMNEKKRKLLGILERRSIADYDSFVHCLVKHSMAHVAKVLIVDGGECLNLTTLPACSGFICRTIGQRA